MERVEKGGRSGQRLVLGRQGVWSKGFGGPGILFVGLKLEGEAGQEARGRAEAQTCALQGIAADGSTGLLAG